ncbi:hypothetical protein [Chloracidobacterium thermophilum]|uniref:hypothetical protein n=1 Tax=Chloracidobacterium thermophilum TaxID=458033 RepID=UPI0007398D45|nr:hypothetical protein [Chloracidobacterium thermophilum]
MSDEPPVEWRGASILMYRLVIQPGDLKVFVISPPLDDAFPTITLPSLPPSVAFLPFRSPQPVHRLKRSRFYEWTWAYEQFVATGFISPWLWRKVRAFNPEVIVALADNSLSHLARKLARRLKVPLATTLPIGSHATFQPWLQHAPCLSAGGRSFTNKATLPFVRVTVCVKHLGTPMPMCFIL